MFPRKFDLNKYDLYVNDFILKSINNRRHISHAKLRFYDLPDARWFVKHCPDSDVKSWTDFVNWSGLFTMKMPKEEAIERIKKYRKELGRPLYYDDFRDPGALVPSIRYINKVWGSLNKMKEEIGLEIIQEDMMSKALDIEGFNKAMQYVFSVAMQNNVPYITDKFISSLDNIPSIACLQNSCRKYYNQTLGEYIKNNGFEIGTAGRGTLHSFDDGEITTSQFEYLLSIYLRSRGLVFGIDYFRDVKYSDFIDSYSGNMNCDYVIKYHGKTIYIEIPGIIEAYKDYYYMDKPIDKSDSREKYRLKLKYKEHLLSSSGLIYYILFPCDLTKNNVDQILDNPSIDLKIKIEQFRKNNIDWDLVLKNGELEYSAEIKYGRNVIMYSNYGGDN